jgi:hypothetical protein
MPVIFVGVLKNSLMIAAYSISRQSNGHDIGLVLNMNECLNSDDEDEENHRLLFSGFEYPHGKSCADAGIQGDERKYTLTLPIPCLIIPPYDRKRRIITPVLAYSKHNGLIS